MGPDYGQFGQGSYQVAEVGPDNTVHIKTVTLGPQIGPDWLDLDPAGAAFLLLLPSAFRSLFA
jgi:hypothetical protein